MYWLIITASTLLKLFFIEAKSSITTCSLTRDPIYNGTKADCNGMGLQSIPSYLPRNTTVLDLSYNHLIYIKDNELEYLVNLRRLDLSFNLIRQFENNSFLGLTNLVRLDVCGHDIDYNDERSLPTDVFKPLVSLQYLSLRFASSVRFNSDHSGGIKTHNLVLPDQTFGVLSNLTTLVIDTARETIFNSGFSKLKKLETLELGHYFSHGKRFNCQLQVIKNQTFQVFKELNIKTFTLIGCRFEILTKYFLNDFPKAEKLYLQKMFIPGILNDVVQAISVYKSLDHVDISSVQSKNWIIDFNDKINTEVLSKICITHLDISDNNIVTIDFDILLTIPRPPFTQCIKILNLSANRITGKMHWYSLAFAFSLLSKLEMLDMSLERTKRIGSSFGRHSYSNSTITFPFLCPANLTYLNLAGIGRTSLFTGLYFFHGNNMINLNISYLGLYPFSDHLYGIPKLQILDLSGNDCGLMNPKFFQTLPNLMILRMGDANLDANYMLMNGIELFEPLIKLEYLDLSRNNLNFLPDLIFKNLLRLKELDLSYNRLTTIPDISTLINLNVINLRFNSYPVLKQNARTMLDEMQSSMVKVELYGNTFSCSCTSGDFLLWLMETRVQFDGKNYSCMDTNGIVTTTQNIFDNYSHFYRMCRSGFWLSLSISFLLITIVLLLATFLMAKNTMKIKLVLLRCIGRNIFPEKRDDFEFDANIIYSRAEYKTARNEMRLKLEEGRKLRLCLGDRNHQLGQSEISNICNSIQNSWKIVLLLTEDFLKWPLSYFIICNCLQAVKLTTPNRLIVLIDTHVNIPTNIALFLEAVTQSNIMYVDYTEPFPEEFWNRLYSQIVKED